MNTKSKIKSFFDSRQENSRYIEKYEENKDFFNDLLKNGHKEDIEFVIPIKIYKYADPLNQTGNYLKALAILREIESDLEKLKGQSKFYNQYSESVIFLKGVCLARLKKYNKSNIEFKKLLDKKENKENFVHWYKSNKIKAIARILDWIAIIGGTYYFIILGLEILKLKQENFLVRDIGLAVGIIALAASYLWKKIIDKKAIEYEKPTT
ncbi:MAG: hypothetical protein AAGU27_29115 [Dehalobacterium sp.]